MEREIFDTTYPEEIFLLKHQPVVIINGPWEQLGETEREQLYKIIAALKIPIHTYRGTLCAKTGILLDDSEVPYEVGYILVKETARGQGHSNVLVSTALAAAGGQGVFATSRIDNVPMHKTLARFCFEKAGKPYVGTDAKEMIQLFLRRGQ